MRPQHSRMYSGREHIEDGRAISGATVPSVDKAPPEQDRSAYEQRVLDRMCGFASNRQLVKKGDVRNPDDGQPRAGRNLHPRTARRIGVDQDLEPPAMCVFLVFTFPRQVGPIVEPSRKEAESARGRVLALDRRPYRRRGGESRRLVERGDMLGFVETAFNQRAEPTFRATRSRRRSLAPRVTSLQAARRPVLETR